MPLSRPQLRNEYGLGVRELYSEASKKEDPKAILDGVAVAGLVGLLRQLGDLAEFAAEVFHGLQEDITATASRSQKLMTRVKHIESALPPLEKAMLSQTSHIHFAYTPGTEWHPRIRNEKNHFIYADLPHCIGDSYEECKEPPRLQLLDKFDTGGLGSCLKRYSDPSFFRRAAGNSSVLNDEKSKKVRKARKAKKRRSWKRSSQLSFDASNFNYSGKQREQSPTQTVSTFDMTFKSDLVDRSDSLGSGDGMGFIECVFHPRASLQTDEAKSKQSHSRSGDKLMSSLVETLVFSDDSPRSSIVEENDQRSSTHTWDEEAEHETSSELGKQEACDSDIGPVDRVSYRSNEMEDVQEENFQTDELKMEPLSENYEGNENLEVHETNLQHHEQDIEESLNLVDTSVEGVDSPSLILDKNEPDGVESETDNFVDALHTIESESENDIDCRTKGKLGLRSHPQDDVGDERISESIHGQSPIVSCSDLDLCESTSVQDVSSGINLAKDDRNADGLREESVGEFLSSTINSPCVSEQPFVESCPIAMWTNGGLLGLQPSKPPDFSTSGSVNIDNNISTGHLNQNLRMEDDNLEEKFDTPANDSIRDNGNANVEQSNLVSSKNLNNHVVVDTSNEDAEHVNDGRASFFTGYKKTRDLENSPHVTLLREEVPSSLDYAPPSPALEHMKISFPPINSLGTSKLKLKYPERMSHFDEISDSFPSFQLVPEPALQHGVVDLDSDDDTFCRSNPCISDDDISHLSDSNSEMWESGDSSGESLSSLAEHEDLKDRSISDDNGSSMNPFGFQETEISYNPEAPMEPFEPPPLPPLQWRVSRTQTDQLEGKETTPTPATDDVIYKASEHVNVMANDKHSGEQNLKGNAQKKLNQAGNVRRVDEQDDFLHQIRTRSFNLRKTGLLKPAPTPAPPPPSVKVTAILEKANAIRQAVASDDGEEDDPWSDT